MIEIKVSNNEKNKRLDKFVKKYLVKAPSSFIYKLFRKNDVKVNKKPKPMDYIVQEDDLIQIYITKDQEKDFVEKLNIEVSNNITFKVIYEDDNVLIVNKPANLLVHDGDDKLKNDDTLSKQVLRYLINKQSYNPDNENIFIPSLAHRIDRNTSGLVIFGKNYQALTELFQAFKNHDGMEKEYETLVSGKVLTKGTINVKLIKNEKTKIVNVDLKNGVEAITLYEPVKVYEDATLLKVNLLTGRTHQIRVHMKYINHPLIGDLKYGNKNSDILAKKYNLKGYFLHAKKICFHNLNGCLKYLNDKEFIAPLFKWEIDLLNKLNGGM